MKSDKLEKQIKEKLVHRTIQPNEASWDRLNAMLSVSEKPKKNRNWIYIAASIIGFLLVATVFLTQTQEMIDVEKSTVENPVTKELDKENNVTLEKILKETDPSVFQKNTIVSQTNKPVSNPVIKNNSEGENSGISKDMNIVIEEKVISKADPVVVEERVSKNKSIMVDVNELLASVDQQKEKIINPETKETIKVNPDNLLSHVDGEIEMTFREKVIKSVNKNYQEVKVALSNRNQK